ncbi:phlebovirus glycoprotein G1, partial [Ostertagia ostertagi]
MGKRSAFIKMPSTRIINRPINMLFKLEIQDKENETTQKNSTRKDRPESHQNLHPMITRSKASNCFNYLLAVALLFITLKSSGASTRCPLEINTPKTIIYATNCTSQGVAIAKYTHNGKDKLCWFPISCPLGAIHFSLPFQPNQKICGPSCNCPSWTKSCSFSTSPRKSLSTLSALPLELASYLPSHVCSFTPSPMCDKKRRIDKFNQIQLFDDSLLVVPELHINIKDYIDSEDFICFDAKGSQRMAKPPYTGTSQFCNKHSCQDNAEILCTFGNPSALYTTHDGKSTILVKAWGITTRDFYGHLNMEPSHGSISTQCKKGGIEFQIASSTDALEACIQNYCHFISNPTNSNVIFPTRFVAFNYEVEVSAWSKGKLIDQQHLNCRASPICEIMDCTICLEKIYNPHCWSKTQIIMATGTFFTCLLLIALIQPFLRVMIRIIRYAISPLRFVVKRIGSKFIRSQRNLATYTGNRRRLLLTIVLLSLKASKQCSHVVTLSASQEECITSGNTTNCNFNQATILTLQPLSQETCLLLKHEDGTSIGLLTIRVDGLYFACQKRIEFFTRDHHFYTESAHRCRFAGSCSTNTCDNTRTSDWLNELSDTANRHPGYSFCAASCGCLTCGGCFFCLASCLFYRYYAYPESPTLYTVFNCPSWEFTVDAHVTLQNNELSEGTDLRLQPAKTVRWNNIRFTLIGSMVPQMPLLSSTFITDGEITAITKPATSGQLLPHTIGQLQCHTIEDAKNFNCTFASN